MTHTINRMNPETAALVRAHIAGKPLPPAIAKAKRAEPVKSYASQFHKFDPRTDTHTIQLPIAFRPAEYNTSRVPQWQKEKWVAQKREMVWIALMNYLPKFRTDEAERARVTSMTFLRYGTQMLDKRDNLRAAFKSVVDATAAYLVWGAAAPMFVRKIGKADGILEQRGVVWDYQQMQHPANCRLYAIQIKLHCAPRTTEQ